MAIAEARARPGIRNMSTFRSQPASVLSALIACGIFIIVLPATLYACEFCLHKTDMPTLIYLPAMMIGITGAMVLAFPLLLIINIISEKIKSRVLQYLLQGSAIFLVPGFAMILRIIWDKEEIDVPTILLVAVSAIISSLIFLLSKKRIEGKFLRN